VYTEVDQTRDRIVITIGENTLEMLNEYCRRNCGSTRSHVIDAVLRWFLGQEPQVSPMELPRMRICGMRVVEEDAPLAKAEWVAAANDEPQGDCKEPYRLISLADV